jgi:hypothetical protein
MLQFESACNRVCEDIASLLIDTRGATRHTAFIAARATRDVAAAMHHASGSAEDALWYEAMTSLEHFLDLCGPLKTLEAAAPRARLRAFIEENVDLLTRQDASLAS